MKKTILSLRKRLTNKKVFLLALLLFTTLIFLAPKVAILSSQRDEVEIKYLSGNEPVKIAALKIGRTLVESDKKVLTSDDLLGDLSATVKNKYGKAVTFIELGVIVVRPEGQENLPPFHFNISLGNRKKALKGENSGLEIIPDSDRDQADLSLTTEDYASIRASLNRLGYPSKIKKLLIQVEEVAFADGTIWSIGSWYRGDPNNYRKLIPLKDLKRILQLNYAVIPLWTDLLVVGFCF